ncbi:unnamed protein product [Gongylonema pulchrum]|uniref:Anoctamin n=1 Tax=Gongylonema pulchrum TaxID=637853 RepID=A0A183D5E0_9BILA|nr:unnamed protein product [Gongylonema pulchrum]
MPELQDGRFVDSFGLSVLLHIDSPINFITWILVNSAASFFREWRFQTCSYLGQASYWPGGLKNREPDWSTAYYFNEAMFISTRQLARAIVGDSKENYAYHFENVEKFKEAVRRLPAGNFFAYFALGLLSF